MKPITKVALMLSLTLALCLLVHTPLRAQIMPILEFRFDECSGRTAHNAGTYLNADGFLNGSAFFSPDVPPGTGPGCSLALDGSRYSYVLVPDTFWYTEDGSSLSPRLGQITMEAWIKPSATSDQRLIWDDYGNPGVILALWDGLGQISVSTDGTPGLGATNFSGTIVTDTWQHIAGVYDGNTLKVFINGQDTCIRYSTSGAIIDQSSVYPGSPAYIGYTAAAPYSFMGLIDDLRIFPVALDRAQLAMGYFARTPYTRCPGDPFRIGFPLKGKNPYTATVSAIFDHTGPFKHNEPKDGKVEAFTGEMAFLSEGGRCVEKNGNIVPISVKNLQSCKTPGYKGEFPILRSTIQYNKDEEYLYYDGHTGYDYPASLGVEIIAPEDGTLCIATQASHPEGTILWRDNNYCPYPYDPVNDTNSHTSWAKWHTFYIIHDINNYTTWYLHSDDIATEVKQRVVEQGYAKVFKGDLIAYVGYTGLGGPQQSHLHFEVRKGDSVVVDPYGSPGGSQPILWDER